MKKRRPGAGFDLKPILITISLLLIPFIVYIFYRISISDNRLVPISAIALISGAIIESKRLSQKWGTVFFTALFSFIGSLLVFLPGRGEKHYVFDEHIMYWPYNFLLIFVILSIGFNYKKIMPRLSECITLVLSAGIIYWVLDHGYFSSASIFLKAMLIIAFCFAFFSIINAFINFNLTKTLRFILSIWSSVIMILIAIDNIYSVFQNGQIEEATLLVEKIIIGLQYFLLGICSIYIVQNILMIAGFLPGRDAFFNKKHFSEIKGLINEHTDRYSAIQSDIILSSICLVLSALFYFLNYKYELLPRNTAIWFVFFVLNGFIYFYEYSKRDTTASNSPKTSPDS
jgi:hypothetical protein